MTILGSGALALEIKAVKVATNSNITFINVSFIIYQLWLSTKPNLFDFIKYDFIKKALIPIVLKPLNK